ncbi:MAG: hypothetical protein HDQ88_05450 [Clostridia bacterium]|nr:hypothetical protein [Clostridia bacterium]
MKTLTVNTSTIAVLQNGFKNMYLDIEKDLHNLTTRKIGWGSEGLREENRSAVNSAVDEISRIGAELKMAVENLHPDIVDEETNSSMKKVGKKANEFEEATRMLVELTKLQADYKDSYATSARKKATTFLWMCERFVDIF